MLARVQKKEMMPPAVREQWLNDVVRYMECPKQTLGEGAEP